MDLTVGLHWLVVAKELFLIREARLDVGKEFIVEWLIRHQRYVVEVFLETTPKTNPRLHIPWNAIAGNLSNIVSDAKAKISSLIIN